MNVDITYQTATGKLGTFTIYNADSILYAVERFVKANPEHTVLGANIRYPEAN